MDTNTSPSSVTVAVVPAAGFGTRMRPLSDALPKEMLPVGRYLALERIVQELQATGIQHIVFVLSPVKEPKIRERFSDSADGLTFSYVLQHEMLGLGHAVLCAKEAVADGQSFVVALGDAVFEEPVTGGLLSRLVSAYTEQDAALGLTVQRVPRERISRYGVVKPLDTASGTQFAITDIVEKPSADDAPSDFAAAARYIVGPEIFRTLEETSPGKGGEIQLTDALRFLLQSGKRGVAVPLGFGEVRHDLGSLDSYYRAFIAFALADADYGDVLRQNLIQTLVVRKEQIVP